MRNDSNKLQGRGTQRSSRSSGFFPNSLRAISSYLRSATSVASTVRSAGASVASSISLPEDDAHRDQVTWAGFDKLELGENIVRRILLLSYMNGFQVWDVEDADDVHELISKQDGPVAFLKMQPRPITSEPSDGGFKAAQPLLLVVTGDGTLSGGNVQVGFGSGYSGGVGSPPQSGSSNFVPTVVRFYSLRSHTYVHVLRFRSAVYTVRCCPHIIAVALAAQIYCFDAATLQNTFSVLTYPMPQGGQGSGGINIGYGPLAVGPRWLAYAANHALVSNSGRVSPQHLTPSPGVSPSTSPANGSFVAHYAKESSKQIAAGIVTLGDMGYKTLTKYCAELLPDGANSPRSGSPSWKSSNGLPGYSYEPEYAGTVIVKDFVGKSVVAQFRAHTSPLSALCFDPSGTLLVTASVHGHNLNIFRIMPSPVVSGSGAATFDVNASYVHLYKLCRGVTHAVIQDISFSDDSHWIAISSSRGTTHLFAISPFGGSVVPYMHEGTRADGTIGSAVSPSPTICWWSSIGPLRVNQQPLPPPPPPITLSVVSRIKNGNGGWRGTVTGAAAAATGRTHSPAGAVAAVFHNRGGYTLQADIRNCSLKDQLWVFSPSGHVIQYALRMSAGPETPYSGNTASGIGGGSCDASQEQDLRVAVETLQKWDVCQRPNRIEREEDIDNLCSYGTARGEMDKQGLGGYRNGTILTHPADGGRMGKEGINAEGKHHWYLSNAEVQMHRARTPVWTKAEIYFQVMMPDVGHNDTDAPSGEIEIERVPTRLVEVRTKDLVPIFDHIQDFKEIQGARGHALESVPGSSAMQIHRPKDECTQDGMIGMSLGCLQMQRSSSGSSCGSLSGFSGGQSMNLNGFHHAYQDSQEHMEGGFYSNSSTTFGHPSLSPTSSEKAVLLDSLKNIKLTNQHFEGKSMCPAANPVSIGSPPMEIPRCSRVEGCTIRALESSLGVDDGSKGLPMNDCGFSKRHVIEHDVIGNVGVIFGGHVMGGLQSSNQGSSCDDKSNSSGASLFHMAVEQETGLQSSELHVRGAPTHSLHDEHTDRGDVAAACDHSVIHLQGEDGIVEDAQNTAPYGKNGDPVKGEHDEDAWEGSMFPFCEEE